MQTRSFITGNLATGLRSGWVALALLATIVVTASAQELPFADAEVYFELNDTDGDLGIHALIDGVRWERLAIEAPVTSDLLLDIQVRGLLRHQGLTELFFESAEPPFERLPPEVFFMRFPQGIYEINGVTLSGRRLRSNTLVTHAMPAPPSDLRVNGLPLPEDCDDEPLPLVSGDLLLQWDPVTTTHEELGSPRGSRNIDVELYQVVLEQDECRAGTVRHGDRHPCRRAGIGRSQGGNHRA